MNRSFELEFKATKKQSKMFKALFNNAYTQVWYWGGAGWGKSYGWVSWIWMLSQKFPKTRWFFGRRQLVNLKKTTLATYYKFLDDYKVPKKYRWHLKNDVNTLFFPNWSEILLLDLAWQPSDPLYTRFGSLELTGGFIDESNEIHYSCIDILNTRLWRQRNKEYNISPKMLETFNPDKGHVYERYYKPFRDEILPEYRTFIPALATDNPHLDENYIQQLERADEITRQRLLFGNFDYDDSPGKLFRWDEISDLFINFLWNSWEYYISVDVSRLWDDKTVIVLRKGMVAEEFFVYSKITTDQIAQKVKDIEQRYWVSRYRVVVDSDWVGGWVADQLRWCVNFVNNASPVNTGDMNPYANLKTQCYFMLREFMEKRTIRVKADGAIQESVKRELDNIMVKDNLREQKLRLETKEEMKNRLGHSPDFADAIMMRMYFVVAELESSGNSTEVYSVDYSDFLF